MNPLAASVAPRFPLNNTTFLVNDRPGREDPKNQSTVGENAGPQSGHLMAYGGFLK